MAGLKWEWKAELVLLYKTTTPQWTVAFMRTQGINKPSVRVQSWTRQLLFPALPEVSHPNSPHSETETRVYSITIWPVLGRLKCSCSSILKTLQSIFSPTISKFFFFFFNFRKFSTPSWREDKSCRITQIWKKQSPLTSSKIKVISERDHWRQT